MQFVRSFEVFYIMQLLTVVNNSDFILNLWYRCLVNGTQPQFGKGWFIDVVVHILSYSLYTYKRPCMYNCTFHVYTHALLHIIICILRDRDNWWKSFCTWKLIKRRKDKYGSLNLKRLYRKWKKNSSEVFAFIY